MRRIRIQKDLVGADFVRRAAKIRRLDPDPGHLGAYPAGQPVIAGQPNPNFADWRGVALAMVTLVIVLIFTKIRATSRFAILLGLLTGTIIALLFGYQTFQITGAAISVPMPFHFGLPVFGVSAIISMFIVMLGVMVETTADILAVGEETARFVLRKLFRSRPFARGDALELRVFDNPAFKVVPVATPAELRARGAQEQKTYTDRLRPLAPLARGGGGAGGGWGSPPPTASNASLRSLIEASGVGWPTAA